MNSKYEIRFGFFQKNTDTILNSKSLKLETEEAAERMYNRVLHHACNRPNPLHGTVAMWNGRWLVKRTNF